MLRLMIRLRRQRIRLLVRTPMVAVAVVLLILESGILRRTSQLDSLLVIRFAGGDLLMYDHSRLEANNNAGFSFFVVKLLQLSFNHLHGQ